MERLIITHAEVLARDRILSGYSVICEDGLIAEVVPDGACKAQGLTIDAGGRYLAPGYIDLHIHGLNGKLIDRGRADLEGVMAELPRHGVTAFLPTVTPAEDEYAMLRDLSGVTAGGAEIVGFFLEGHFLALTGAIRTLRPDYSADRALRLQEALGTYGAVFGVSPEIPGIDALIPRMVSRGCPAFITHTKANFEQTDRAIQAGARHATHFYDVFPYIGEQEPGVRGCGTVEAIMAHPEVSVDFILDGEHVNPGAVRMALACKGPDAVCLITDANLNAGMAPGVYKGINDVDVVMEYPGGPARERRSDGSAGGLTGSGLTLDLAVQNAVKLLGLSLPQAAAMASANPARVLGLADRRGRIEKGYRADFSLLDKELSVTECYVAGKKRFQRSSL
ncbi:N-acetylglucosamine-6-phosphate deacetylase [Spirochaetia bacterium]|nr:N-acetylglucosamine-6-phosphate deacetylase [Spirochaetia bacterium]